MNLNNTKSNKGIYILGIETSCDETAAAVVKNGREVLSNSVYTQIKDHIPYGGVVPEIASRKHIEKIDYVVESAIKDSGINPNEIDAVAVTYGPGLVGAVLVGMSYAKAYAYALNKPLIGVHHIMGHICANYISNPDLEPPYICLIASGGHSHLVKVIDYTEVEVIGRTRDDACGEAFDKIARRIGLGYPGGPKIDKEAKLGNPNAIEFPTAKVCENKFDFSFSGVKSAVLNYINKIEMSNQKLNIPDLCASFQNNVVNVLVNHTIKAALEYDVSKIAIAGGVAANSELRAKMSLECERNNITYYEPDISLCGDNAAMIGASGYYEFLNGNFKGLDLNAVPNLKLGGVDRK